MNLGVTGHRDLPGPAKELLLAHLSQSLSKGITGVSCLAEGADQIFARQVLAFGGRLVVVIPCAGYASTFSEDDGADSYRELVGQAAGVERLGFARPSREAFVAAGKRLVDLSDQLLAVWDGLPARGPGGTADVVSYAGDSGKRVHRLWPEGVDR